MRRLLLLFLLLFLPSKSGGQAAFTFRDLTIGIKGGAAPGWQIKVATTTSPQDFKVGFTTPTNLVVLWGDGNSDTYNTGGVKTHSYATAGTNTITMRGVVALVDFFTSATPTLVKQIVTAEQGVTGITSFIQTFRGCTGLIGSIPTDFGRYSTSLGANGYYATFRDCTSLTGSIPTDFGRYNTGLGSFGYRSTFGNCTGLTGSIPTDFGRYNTGLSSLGYYYTFQNCTSLTGSIPTDFGRYSTSLGDSGYSATFYGCTSLTGSIPTDFGRYNTSLGASGYNYTFYGCTSLTGSIPTDFGRYNTLLGASGYYYTFYGCSKLTGAPSTLFNYTPLNLSLDSTLRGCTLMVGAIPSLTVQTNVTVVDFRSSGFTNWTASTIPAKMTNVNFSGCALIAAAVNQCLVDFDTAGTSNGSLNLSGASMAAPTAGPPDGVTAKANLVARGWTVTTQ